MTEKEAILRDLKVIAILDDKIDYSDHDNIGAVLKLNPKSLFSTEYGDRYLERVRQMYNGDDYEKTCILCGSPLDGDGPICSNCYKMITIGNAQIPEKPAPIHTSSDQEEIKEEAPAEKEAEEQKKVAVEEPADQEVAAAEEPADQEVPAAEETVDQDESVAADEETSETVSQETESDSKPASYDREAGQGAVEEKKMEDSFADDAMEVQQTYDELNQDMIDPKARKIYAWRAIIMLFVVACFSIGIVCGLVLMIRHAGGTMCGMVTEQSAGEEFQEYKW